MRDTFGEAISVTLFGESHGEAIGAVVHGVSAGVKIDSDFIAWQMEKRRAKGSISTKRSEADRVRFLSGVKNGYATGTAISLIIENTNTKSEDYAKTQELLRPGHADFTAHAKYKGFQDARGGGHFSGRLTAPIVAAGAIFTNILSQKGVTIATHMLSCGNVRDDSFASCQNLTQLKAQMDKLNNSEFAVINPQKGEEMTTAITKAANEGDSVGGVLETAILGLPAGLGEPFFSSVESVISHLMFSMPAVKGIEFGDGFSLCNMYASEANDAFCMQGEKIVTKTNHNGGINGGITNGMPIIFRTAVKPTPSIYKKQETVDFLAKKNANLEIHGRHDPCIVHRGRVVQDSLAAMAIAEVCGMAYGTSWQQEAFLWNMD